MPETMQDVFWDGFADEVEKISGAKAKLAVGAGVAAGVAALASKGKENADMVAKGFTGKTKGPTSAAARTRAQMEAAE